CRQRAPSGGLADREPDEERRAAALGALDPDAASVRLGDMAHDREPEPRAAPAPDARLVDLVEALEDAVDLRPRDADPVVLDRQHDRLPVAPRPHDDGFALAGELDGVVQQVDEQLAKALLVAADRRQVARDGTLERHPLAI